MNKVEQIEFDIQHLHGVLIQATGTAEKVKVVTDRLKRLIGYAEQSLTVEKGEAYLARWVVATDETARNATTANAFVLSKVNWCEYYASDEDFDITYDTHYMTFNNSPSIPEPKEK